MTPDTAYTTATLTGFILEDQAELTLDDVCRACAAQPTMIIELVDEGVIAPSGTEPAQWRFSGIHIHRARVAVRLQRDLGVNLAGAALALQLMDEMAALRARLQRLSGE